MPQTLDLAALQRMLANGANVDTKDEDERTPLHWAAAEGAQDVVEFLADHAHARLDVQDDAGWTPLMSAASAGHLEVVSMLLSRGADANMTNSNGQLALHYHKGRQPIVEILLDYTKDINHSDHLGQTPLMRALRGTVDRGLIALLIDYGAKLNPRDKLGNTALHLALAEGHEDIARFLVENGADPTARNKAGVKCIDHARPAFRAELQTLQQCESNDRTHRP